MTDLPADTPEPPPCGHPAPQPGYEPCERPAGHDLQHRHVRSDLVASATPEGGQPTPSTQRRVDVSDDDPSELRGVRLMLASAARAFLDEFDKHDYRTRNDDYPTVEDYDEGVIRLVDAGVSLRAALAAHDAEGRL